MQYAVIMAGGAGTRLWPAARRDRPKQLQRLIFEKPLIEETVDRLKPEYAIDRILVVTAEQYAQAIAEVLPGLPPENIISEPMGRNTAAAIGLAAFRLDAQDSDAVFAVFPADHAILKPSALISALGFANQLAHEHRVVDIGVPPDRPETGYGYIELGQEIAGHDGLHAYEVRRFVEKPNLETAERYVAAGHYIWNSGMFVWRAKSYLQALQEYLPDTFEVLEPVAYGGDFPRLADAYGKLPDISVDYGIMEKISDVVALPVDFGWRDVGDWAALYDMTPHDSNGNAYEGSHVGIDTHDSLLLAPDKLVATIGVNDLVVVDTDDVLLVMKRDRAQEVKGLLERLKKTGKTGYL